jgi:hypothetical protein
MTSKPTKLIFSKSLIPSHIRDEMVSKGIWQETCPVPLDRLLLLTITYIDFEVITHNNGQMIVLDAVADNVLKIFKELYELKFPIAKIKLINEYDGKDELSMADNNSSCFNYREIIGGGKYSIHSYGLAIDINPIQNPYVDTRVSGKIATTILPPQGVGYLDRANLRPGMVEKVVDIFNKYGFTVWGGNWNDFKDWHHFQPTREQAEMLAKLSVTEAKKYFEEEICKK